MTTHKTKKQTCKTALLIAVVLATAALLIPVTAFAGIDGVEDLSGTPAIEFTAREGYVSIPDGGSIYSWGYSLSALSDDALMQLPGPTIIVEEGATVTVTLNNALPAAAGNVSILFPGHVVSTSGGVPGALTQEAPPGGSVTYMFDAPDPGTYQYHSGTRPDLQVEMGLYGALIVVPDAGSLALAGCSTAAYGHPDACFDREYLFLLSEIDIDIHQAAQLQAAGPGPIDIGEGPFSPEYWMINGRAAPDTMAAAGTALLPTQPYNCMPRMHPGERLLMRMVGAGRDLHPYHHHGNHARVVARDGRLLESTTPGYLAGPLLFTQPTAPGSTADAIFEWTGKDLGWDIYGTTDMNPHTCKDTSPVDGYGDSDADYPWEWCADHDRAIPVDLPDNRVMAFGGFWSGSPYLGVLGSLPPGEGGLNPNGGFSYMWHSHTEREMVNNDVFPGGMMTMLIIEAPGVLITD